MAEPYSASGTKVFIGPSVVSAPADAAAYALLTPWVEVGKIETVGEYGDEASINSISLLGDARVRKSKGARDAGALTLTCADDPQDVGQAALIAAEALNGNYAVKVVSPNRLNATGTDGIEYFIGLVTSKRKNVGGNENIVRRTYTLTINSKIVEVAPTAGA